ncbi:hypothetical protein GCM10007108_09910 [Thermogymnomonas acidicola]|uniref:Uncharacterized protein n=1 Tax=Thermogymnomonas acidicola TaxID=399579 RepID=A0AA37BRB1_9ARCH|nr:hypothetical protein [Thermogymnomonas acidicola]GGM73960.1 hypothetical protein GCM10007108_09910 [Thermogymnomonas acidicola]
MKIEVGQRFDLEIDREDVEGENPGPIIATWYHMGTPIYVELSVNKSLLRALRDFFRKYGRKSAIVSIARVSRYRYEVTPTVVLLNRQGNDVRQMKF